MTLRATVLALVLIAATPAAAQVEVQQLAPLDLFSAGARDTGLPADLWKGASSDIMREVLPRLTSKSLPPAAAGFARRVLATASSAPEGAGTDAGLAAARAQALIALGDAQAAASILERAPNLQGSAVLSEAAAEAALTLGDDDRACAVADRLIEGRDAVYWLRLRAYCQARAGQLDAAQLTFTLANQKARDAVYARLMGAVLTGSAPGAYSARNGLDVALSRRLLLEPPPVAEPAAPVSDPTLARNAAAGARSSGFDEAFEGAVRAPAKARAVQQGRVLVLVALGAPMDTGQRAQLAGFTAAKTGAGAGRLAALDLAADRGLVGETALLALSIAADGPSLADRARIVRALKAVGLADDALALAIEALEAP